MYEHDPIIAQANNIVIDRYNIAVYDSLSKRQQTSILNFARSGCSTDQGISKFVIEYNVVIAWEMTSNPIYITWIVLKPSRRDSAGILRVVANLVL